MKASHVKKQSLSTRAIFLMSLLLLNIPILVQGQDYWSVFGNTIYPLPPHHGIIPKAIFIGTVNDRDFNIRTYNTQRVVVKGSSGFVGIGTASPQSLFSVGASSPFQVSSAGDLAKINNVHYSFPATQGLPGTVLLNDGSGNLTWASGAGAYWSLTGNNTTVGNNKIGTTNQTPLVFIVNNYQAGYLDWDPLKGNVGFGYQALFSLNAPPAGIGTRNIALGYQALYSTKASVGNVAIGYQALYNNIATGAANIAIGDGALFSNTSGFGNIGIGPNALYYNNDPNANNNIAIGNSALSANTTGSENTAVGSIALEKNTTGGDNTAIGSQALICNTTAADNTAIGFHTLHENKTGSGNTAVGVNSLISNTSGSANVAIGGGLSSNTVGEHNTAIGVRSLEGNTIGNWNTSIGASALLYDTTGSYNTALGFQADVSTGNLTNATAIGANAMVDASNKVRIGDCHVTMIEGQVAYSFPSDGRFKFNIHEDVKGLSFILKLRPVTYQFDAKHFDEFQHAGNNIFVSDAIEDSYKESSMIRRSGFIAQEVEIAANESGYDFNGINKPKSEKGHYSLSYEEFVVPLVKAVQEQQKQIGELIKQVEELKKVVASQPPK